jgi:hypothetical protein
MSNQNQNPGQQNQNPGQKPGQQQGGGQKPGQQQDPNRQGQNPNQQGKGGRWSGPDLKQALEGPVERRDFFFLGVEQTCSYESSRRSPRGAITASGLHN